MSKKKQSRSERRAQERKARKSQKQEIKTTKKPVSKLQWLAGLFAIAITLICFHEVDGFEFTNWDDDRNTYENPNVVNFSFDEFGKHTKNIFSSHVIGNYNPLTILTFGIDKELHGIDSPGPWHWENVILHLICVWLVYQICLLLGLSWRGALFAALLFGIHPMRVESVSWITERKDVLFGAFFLGALALYIKQKSNPSMIKVVSITILFILALLSKIQAVTLPLTLLAVDYYMDKNVSWKNVWNKAHYFLLSLIVGLVGIHFLGKQGSLETNETFEFFDRIFIGAFSFIVYLIKSIIPYRLSPLYPYPSSLPWYFYVSIVIVPIFLYALWKLHKSGKKIWIFGLLVFTFNIMFMLQVLGAGQGFIADRFTYIPYLGLFFIAAYYLDQVWKSDLAYRSIVIGVAAIYIVVMGWMTYQQNKIWQNSGTMWTHVLQYYQQSTLPYGNRANYYRNIGEYEKALSDYSKTLALKADNPEAYNSRGRLYFTKGGNENIQKALQDYTSAITIMEKRPPGPDRNRSLGEFYINRGATYARLGETYKAIEEMNKGIELKPDHESGYLNRSVMYNQLGDYPKALADIETYFKYNPYNPDLWYESARLKRALNRATEAIDDYSRAIQLNPKKGIFYYERARTYQSLGNTNEAKSDLSMAIQLGYSNIDPAFRQSLGM